MKADYTVYFAGVVKGKQNAGGIGGTIFEGDKFLTSVRAPIGTNCTKDVAEYMGLIHVLGRLIQQGGHFYEHTVAVCSDSEQVMRQMKGDTEMPSPLMVYSAAARAFVARFADVTFSTISHSQNRRARDCAQAAVNTEKSRTDRISFQPNTKLASRICIDGERFVGSSDFGACTMNKWSMVDAGFICNLPGYGLDAITQRLLPVHFTFCHGNNFDVNVLGMLVMRFEFGWSIPEVRLYDKTLAVMVVDSLPVPFHVGAFHRSIKGCQESGVTGSEEAVRFNKNSFPSEFRDHKFWADYRL